MDVGDVIRLDHTVNDALVVRIQDTPRFQARPGLAGRKMAVQIIGAYTEDAEEERK